MDQDQLWAPGGREARHGPWASCAEGKLPLLEILALHMISRLASVHPSTHAHTTTQAHTTTSPSRPLHGVCRNYSRARVCVCQFWLLLGWKARVGRSMYRNGHATDSGIRKGQQALAYAVIRIALPGTYSIERVLHRGKQRSMATSAGRARPHQRQFPVGFDAAGGPGAGLAGNSGNQAPLIGPRG